MKSYNQSHPSYLAPIAPADNALSSSPSLNSTTKRTLSPPPTREVVGLAEYLPRNPDHCENSYHNMITRSQPILVNRRRLLCRTDSAYPVSPRTGTGCRRHDAPTSATSDSLPSPDLGSVRNTFWANHTPLRESLDPFEN